MKLTDLLLTRLSPQMPELPVSISRARIKVSFTAEAIARGVPAQVMEGIGARLGDATALFRAGYAATAFGLGQHVQLTLRAQTDGYMIDVADAVHSQLLVQIMLRLAAAEGQTPFSAYDRLLAAVDGDEAAAQEAYFPLNFLADTHAVTVTAEGEGAKEFTLAPPLTRPDLAALIGEISSKDAQLQLFTMPSGTSLEEEVENGFLSLQNSGVFGRDIAVSEPEPEIFITGEDRFGVDGWSDDPAYLAELLWVLARGKLALVGLLDGG
ncbi:MAG: hypothetical protein Q4G36_03810 [Paracoccus sp. (in: a-proteobacteria)]|nr:hypothetical protein [Paracoccus sp. (in: a-proteobacteria)]